LLTATFPRLPVQTRLLEGGTHTSFILEDLFGGDDPLERIVARVALGRPPTRASAPVFCRTPAWLVRLAKRANPF
jgi:hypothetical protein